MLNKLPNLSKTTKVSYLHYAFDCTFPLGMEVTGRPYRNMDALAPSSSFLIGMWGPETDWYLLKKGQQNLAHVFVCV